jgi:hypothetical protein
MTGLDRPALRNAAIAAVVTATVGFIAVAASGSIVPPRVRSSGGPTPTSSPGPPVACQTTFSLIPTEDAGEIGNELLAVSATSPSDAWAVGGSGGPEDPPHALYEHFDGTSWTAVQGPSPGALVNQLLGIDEISSSDVWAVGRLDDGSGDRPLLVHWDGTRWTAFDAPPLTSAGRAIAVSASGPADVWAVGSTGDPTLANEQALVLHFDGKAWTQVDVGSAVGGGQSRLLAVGALAPDDVWAVGSHHLGPLVLHFDGTSWTREDVQTRGALDAVFALAPDDVWAAGESVMHFDGEAWSQRDRLRQGAEIMGLAGSSTRDVWGVGFREVASGGSTTIVMHWDGRAWSPVTGPRVPGHERLDAATAPPEGTVLAVGSRSTQSGTRTFAVRGEPCGP